MKLEYSSIQELIKIIETETENKVVDVWQENKFYVLFLSSGIKLRLIMP